MKKSNCFILLFLSVCLSLRGQETRGDYDTVRIADRIYQVCTSDEYYIIENLQDTLRNVNSNIDRRYLGDRLPQFTEENRDQMRDILFDVLYPKIDKSMQELLKKDWSSSGILLHIYFDMSGHLREVVGLFPKDLQKDLLVSDFDEITMRLRKSEFRLVFDRTQPAMMNANWMRRAVILDPDIWVEMVKSRTTGSPSVENF